MSTFNLDLLFLDEGAVGRPMALVQVKRFHGQQHRSITCHCLTPSEFDNEIDRLHGELEKVRHEGKQEFTRAQGRVRTPSDGFRSPARKAS
jgi:hypothetical protein